MEALNILLEGSRRRVCGPCVPHAHVWHSGAIRTGKRGVDQPRSPDAVFCHTMRIADDKAHRVCACPYVRLRDIHAWCLLER